MSEQQPEDEATKTAQTDDQSEDSSGSVLEESEPGDIGDDKLPEDLRPTEDNPLARHPGQSGDDDDKIGANTEGGASDNPSANMAYGSGDSNAPSDEPDTNDDNEDEDSNDAD